MKGLYKVSKAIKNLVQSAWFFPILILIGFVVVTKGRIIGALGPLWRFLLPAGLVYVVYRVLRKRFQKHISVFGRRMQEELMKQQAGQQHGRGPVGTMRHAGPVIEICPTCGEPKSARCRH